MTTADLGRFKRILAMLGSPHVGERAAAALLATNWLNEHNLSWSDVSVRGEAPAPSGSVVSEYAPAEPDMMQAARESKDALRKTRRARWEGVRHAPDADGFESGER